MAAGVFKHPGKAIQLSGIEVECQEYGRDGLPPLSGSGHTVIGGVRAAEDMRGTIVLVEAVSQGAVIGVWGGDAVGIAGIPPKKAERESSGREAELSYRGPRQRSTNLQDGFTNRGGTKELSCQGVLGKGSNIDSDAGPHPTPAFQGQRGNNGGGQPTPPTVHPVQYSDALKVAERAASYHH